MLTEDLFRQVLIAPALQSNHCRLQIVSGFATANMADRHMDHLSKLNTKASIELIVGMTVQSGIEKAQHKALCKLANEGAYGLNFSCRYVVKRNPVHAKTYLWLNEQKIPIMAFSGSANYTLTAFSRSQVENMVDTDCLPVENFYKAVFQDTIDCLDETVPEKLMLTETRQTGDISEDTITLSLLVEKTGETHIRSGLNWGQRPGRDKNQAYIPIPATVTHKKFFPPRGQQFTVLTDDDYSFIFVVAQDGSKALHTTQSNALLGTYIRNRIRVNDGQYITRHHLVEYGRTDISFTKIDDETYLMDFRPNMGPGEDAEAWQE